MILSDLRRIPICKTSCFTDIHFGKKNNSHLHNQDCVDFVEWFCEQVKKDDSITHICFLGDWFENRSAINVSTLEYSYTALKMLNALGLPIIFIVGNHDLHRRSTREIHSVNIFNEFDNIFVVDEPTVIGDSLFCPFLFESEYPSLAQYNKLDYFYGHFEFKNFKITGYNMLMKHGPDHSVFSGPKRIMSGHFHVRQIKDNVIYMGNTFPMDYGDADDTKRGMMINNHITNEVVFIDWPDLPTYHKMTLSKLLTDQWNPRPKMRVKCNVDVDISYSEAQLIKEATMKEYNLRELILEENPDKQDAILEGDDDIDNNMTINEIVVSSIMTIEDVNTIDNDRLISIYNSLSEE